MPGYRLLRLRAHDALRKSAGIKISTKIKIMESKWKICLNKCNARQRRCGSSNTVNNMLEMKETIINDDKP